MNLRWLLFVVLMLSDALRLSATWYDTRTFHYLGGKTYQHMIDPQNRPEPAAKKGVKFVELGFSSAKQPAGTQGVKYRCELKIRSSREIKSILVEDVTDAQPVILIFDQAPKIEKKVWRKEGEWMEVSRTNTPWAYEKKDSWRTYRITVRTEKRGDIVLLQPSFVTGFHRSLIRGGMKDLLSQFRVKGPPPQQSDPTHARFSRSANALLKGGAMFIILDLVSPTTDTTIKDAIKGLDRARLSRCPFVIASTNRAWAYELVSGMLEQGGKQAFKRIKLVVIAPDIDPERYTQLAKQYRVKIMTGPLLD